MKAVILCGGMGTRLREETEYRPKPMVEIGGQPILWHIMKTYASYGITDFVLCLGYKGWMIKEYFLNYAMMSNDFTLNIGKHDGIELHSGREIENWRITLADTGLNTNTGARVKQIEKYIDTDTFMLTYGDGIANVDISDLLSYHQGHGKTGTVTGVNPPSKFGELSIRGKHVLRFEEKPKSTCSLISGGFFVFNRAVFDHIDANQNQNFENDPLEALAMSKELMVYKHKGFWQCMDTYRDFLYLNQLWEQGDVPWKVWT
ncbi:glucose-1-phosphate cytidylyltransferase [bacterium]|nr:glucose-1-phosphate cytidylyltransferase [bacterium]